MKKISFIILLTLLAPCVSLHSQDYVRYSAETECNNVIIRSYSAFGTRNEVIYSRDPVQGQGYIELWVEGVGTCRIPVLQGYDVSDMKVYNSLLYFCGKHGSCGFIAVLNLHDMYTHVTSPTHLPANAAISYTDLSSNQVSSLEKLVVNGSGTSVFPNPYANEHIAAIGKKGSAIFHNDWVAVHLKYDNLFLGTSGIYSSVNVDVDVLEDFSCPASEPIQEVLLTGSYVAFVRYRQATDEYIIHRCDKYNIPGTYSTKYKYAAPHNEGVFAIKGVSLEDNHLALAAVAADADFSGTYEIRIRNIDLYTMGMVSSQRLQVDDLKQDIELIYNAYQQKIVLMADLPIYASASHLYFLVDIDPLPVFMNYNPYYYYYIADAIHDYSEEYFFSLDDADGPYFVALASDIWMRKKMPFNTNGYVTNSCYYSSYHAPNPLLSIEPTVDEGNTQLYQSIKEAARQEVRIRDIETNIECMIEEEQVEININK